MRSGQAAEGIRFFDAGGLAGHIFVDDIGEKPCGGLLDKTVLSRCLGMLAEVVAEGEVMKRLPGVLRTHIQVVGPQVGLIKMTEGIPDGFKIGLPVGVVGQYDDIFL